ncbi:MAG: HU family DNA-binding protein [Yoonia sp.]|nr:HU family DNA-binding protein [Yoonia sp.]
MATESKSSSKTVKLKTVAPDPVVTPLADTKALKTEIAPPAVTLPQREIVKKPEFIDRALTRTEVKKRDAKPAIEAALIVLADALVKGEELNLPPMGKLRVVKCKDVGEGAKVLTLKLRTMKDGAGLGASPSDNNED